MTTDINNFITLDTFKNGKLKISQTDSQEANVYKLLRNFGYGKIKLANKIIYIKREATSFKPIHHSDIRQAFFTFLDNDADFSNIHDETNRIEIINWFYQKNAVKKNSYSDCYLSDNLTDVETHTLSMLSDHDYKRNFEIDQMLSNFEIWNFVKTIDMVGAFRKGDTLYYKKIGDKKYLVFNHFKRLSKNGSDSFDCWFASYLNENQIGNNIPSEQQDIRLGFDFERDFHLIKEYIN